MRLPEVIAYQRRRIQNPWVFLPLLGFGTVLFLGTLLVSFQAPPPPPQGPALTRTGLLGPILAAALGGYGISALYLWWSPAPWLWTGLIGLGPLVFPLLLALFGLRTRSHHAAAQLSGFVQTIGYAGGAVGPLLVGTLHEVTGGWSIPLAALLCISVVSIIPAIALRRPVMLEDELAVVAARG
ncbi:MAG TPA: hypothetical protein PKO12_06315 [Holophaga sp.]|nr:hypothetical protein [Holophaga sp.]